MVEPVRATKGILLEIRTDFSSGEFIAVCSLSTRLDTEQRIELDYPANYFFNDDIDPSGAFSAGLIEQASKIWIAPELCERWQDSAQLAMVMEYDLALEYGEDALADCTALNADDLVLPIQLSIEK